MIVKQFLLNKVDITLRKVEPYLEKWFGMPDKIPDKTRKNPNWYLFGSISALALAIYSIYGFLIGKDNIFMMLMGLSLFFSASTLYRTWVIIRK